MPAIVAGSCRQGKLEGWANAGERIQQKLSRTHLTRIVETHQHTSLRFICHPHHNPRLAWRQTSVGQYQLQEVVAVKSERHFCSAGMSRDGSAARSSSCSLFSQNCAGGAKEKFGPPQWRGDAPAGRFLIGALLRAQLPAISCVILIGQAIWVG
jgi:hypothetical protein